MDSWNNAVPNRDEIFQAKRRAMLQEAVAAFNQKGFYVTSMDDIAKNLGVTKAALYYYFPNKQALLVAAFDHALQVAFHELGKAKKNGETGYKKLHHAIQGYLESALSGLNRCVILTEEHAISSPEKERIIKCRDRFEHDLRELVREGIQDGSVIPCDPKLAIFAIFGAVNSVPKWFLSDGPWNSSQLAKGMADLLCRSIAAQPSSNLGLDISKLKI